MPSASAICPTHPVPPGARLAPASKAYARIGGWRVRGVVRDETGGVLPGATVVATQPTSGFTVARVTDVNGRFFMPSLPIGVWELSAESPGFRRTVQTGVILEIGRTLDLQYRGSVFAFVRDERFDAYNFFDSRDAPVPPLDQGQFGGTFGGPLSRDRTFSS